MKKLKQARCTLRHLRPGDTLIITYDILSPALGPLFWNSIGKALPAGTKAILIPRQAKADIKIRRAERSK